MTAQFHPYASASWDGTWAPQFGTRNLQLALLQRFDRSMDFGIFNDRTVRGGSSPSLHREGRAGDLGFPSLHAQGFEARDVLLANSWELGLQALIWDRKWYSKAYPLGRYYDGVNPHRDHIHYEQTWGYARYFPLTLATATYQIGEPMLTLEEQATLNELVQIRRNLLAKGSSLSVVEVGREVVLAFRKLDDVFDAIEI